MVKIYAKYLQKLNYNINKYLKILGIINENIKNILKQFAEVFNFIRNRQKY